MDQYEPLEVIGTGAFGKVTKVKRKTDDKVTASTDFLYLIHPYH